MKDTHGLHRPLLQFNGYTLVIDSLEQKFSLVVSGRY